jgi:hypothetical protein
MTVFYIVTFGLAIIISVLFTELKRTIGKVLELSELLADYSFEVKRLGERVAALEADYIRRQGE